MSQRQMIRSPVCIRPNEPVVDTEYSRDCHFWPYWWPDLGASLGRMSNRKAKNLPRRAGQTFQIVEEIGIGFCRAIRVGNLNSRHPQPGDR